MGNFGGFGKGIKAHSHLSYSDSRFVHKDGTTGVPNKNLSAKVDLAWTDSPVLTGTYDAPDGFRRPGLFKGTDKQSTEFFPEGAALMLLRGLFDTVTDTTLAVGVYKHAFTSTGNIGVAEGFSITNVYDNSFTSPSGATSAEQYDFFGFQPTETSIKMTKGKPVTIDFTLAGLGAKHGVGYTGTSASSYGGVITFTNGVAPSLSSAVLHISVIVTALNINTSVVNVSIPDGIYDTPTKLSTAINNAILNTAALCDSADRLPYVAAFVDASNKLNFVTFAKGTTATVTVTVSSAAALTYSTPTEAAGSATVAVPTFPSVVNISPAIRLKPFLGTKCVITYGGNGGSLSEIAAEEFTIDIKNGLKLDTYMGWQYDAQTIIDGRRVISGTVKVKFNDVSNWDAFLNDTAKAMDVVFGTGVVISAPYNYSAEIKLPRVKLTKECQPVTNAFGTQMQTLTWTANLDAADGDAVEIDVINTQATV